MCWHPLQGGSGQRPPPPAELQELQKSSHRLRVYENTWSVCDCTSIIIFIQFSYRLMNVATDRLKTVFAHSAYEFENITDGRGVPFPAILIVCMSVSKPCQYNNPKKVAISKFYRQQNYLFVDDICGRSPRICSDVHYLPQISTTYILQCNVW